MKQLKRKISLASAGYKIYIYLLKNLNFKMIITDNCCIFILLYCSTIAILCKLLMKHFSYIYR